jgi:hypothetical protein
MPEHMFLRGAKNKCFLLLVDRVHEQFDAIFFALLDLDDAVEIVLGVTPAFLDLALDQLVIGGVDAMIERGGDLLDLKGSQIAVIDPFLEGIDVNRLSEIGVGINIAPPFGRRGQLELHGGREILQNATPVAFVVRAAPVALVDDDEIEEVRRIAGLALASYRKQATQLSRARVRGGMGQSRATSREGRHDREALARLDDGS